MIKCNDNFLFRVIQNYWMKTFEQKPKLFSDLIGLLGLNQKLILKTYFWSERKDSLLSEFVLIINVYSIVYTSGNIFVLNCWENLRNKNVLIHIPKIVYLYHFLLLFVNNSIRILDFFNFIIMLTSSKQFLTFSKIIVLFVKLCSNFNEVVAKILPWEVTALFACNIIHIPKGIFR